MQGEIYTSHCICSIQPITLMGIDELHTSWLTNTEWRMSKLSHVIFDQYLFSLIG